MPTRQGQLIVLTQGLIIASNKLLSFSSTSEMLSQPLFMIQLRSLHLRSPMLGLVVAAVACSI
jgi:hypothetical protein